MKTKAILFLGSPGCGKTSVCKILNAEKKYMHISFGEELRKNIEEGTANPILQEHIDNGFPIPPEFVVPEVKRIIEKYSFAKQFDPLHHILLFDGCPRNEQQFLALREAYEISSVFLFSVQDKELLFQRIKNKSRTQQRIDDQDDSIIQRRIDIVNKELPKILFYFKKENIFEIDSESMCIEDIAVLISQRLN